MHYSPSLALATAAFEVIIALWAMSHLYRLAQEDKASSAQGAHREDTASSLRDRPVLRTTASMLWLLAGYQLAEVAICAHTGVAGFLPRLAFLIVTWLPPLGLLLIAQIHRPRARALYLPAHLFFAASTGITAWILLDPGFAVASVCNAVFAHYSHAMPRFLAYGAFYWAGLLGMLILSTLSYRRCADAARRRMTLHVGAGTAAFVIPSLLVTQFVPPARGALPSIMCHFALLFAISLARMLRLEARTSRSPVRRAAHGT